MTYFKNVNGDKVPMTPDEIQERQSEENAWVSSAYQRAIKKWEIDRIEDYERTSDPLVPQVLCGEKTQEELETARASVKARHPKPNPNDF